MPQVASPRARSRTRRLLVVVAACACGGEPTAPPILDSLPPTPRPLSPADGARDVPSTTALCWEPVADPDGEDVRYRVFVDGLELTEGILGDEPGHPGPCIGPLDLNLETSYSWEVQAFEVDDPTRTSPRSQPATFTTGDDGASGIVFRDDFTADFGWTLLGDATTGAWTRGAPTAATLDGELRRPGRGDPGGPCMFTGGGGVTGGEAVLLSPPFDLEGAATATVELRRFFFKSAPAASGELRIELLTPDPNLPGEYLVHALEQLSDATAITRDNRWTPREYSACGAPMVDGARLRIRATNLDPAVVEAAIDAVTVRAHEQATLCDAGSGAFCDPLQGPATCGDGLLCCAQGVLNTGVHRCAAPVAGLDFAAPPATPDAPGNGALGCDAPDLIVDGQAFFPIIHDIEVSADSCELAEGCLGGLGGRRLLLFSAAIPNIGSADLVMGIPANHPELFHYSGCHDHYHFEEFARYELLDGPNGVVVAEGHKQAFCMLDSNSWAWPVAQPRFTCENQGISRGFTDIYESGLPCQWVDITGVPPGEYTLRITVNQAAADAAVPRLNERDYDNNAAQLAVTIP